ncbi:MAG: hypothetical protein WCY95_04895, partial [Castellaniella sp.]
RAQIPGLGGPRRLDRHAGAVLVNLILFSLLAALTFAVATLDISLVDYYLIAKGEIRVADLYREDGAYQFHGG